ncbi:glucosamine-6-phosphate deaminase [Promicromonospora sp. Populi]|uniref:glucosamine-6-phosphate deaminase n=1 Tax=Promicromonospora sp. Populi TaxID=3239420 RepID=UPI0034E23658
MQVVILETAEHLGDYAASRIVPQIGREIRVLGVATGSSPLPIYRSLQQQRTAEFDNLSVFALDEYVGLDTTHPEGYRAVVDREVTQTLRIASENVHVPDGSLNGIDTAGERYEALIRAAGGIDLQLLGIGSTGHIGFNEPTSSFASRTRVKTLTHQTRADNARFFGSLSAVPTHCVTQGLGTIMAARELLLIATGASKAGAIAQAVEGPVASMCPASVLQLHQRATVLLDRAAASQLQLRDYYEFAHQNRPSWQA